VPGKSKFHCDIRKSFATAFKNWRRTHNVPLKQIAADLGVSVNTINLWELGRRFPSGEHFELLAEYTGQSPCQLFCVMADQCTTGKCLLAKWSESNSQPAPPPRLAAFNFKLKITSGTHPGQV